MDCNRIGFSDFYWSSDKVVKEKQEVGKKKENSHYDLSVVDCDSR